MEQYIIKGGNPLVGEVVIGGAKNAALGILAAAIMTDGECLIDNMPNVRDTNVLLQAMEGIGATIDRKGLHFLFRCHFHFGFHVGGVCQTLANDVGHHGRPGHDKGRYLGGGVLCSPGGYNHHGNKGRYRRPHFPACQFPGPVNIFHVVFSPFLYFQKPLGLLVLIIRKSLLCPAPLRSPFVHA